jgi:hypothetical protein
MYNISAGGWDEHYTSEWVDLGYTKRVLEAACKLNWESLPTDRPVFNYTLSIDLNQDIDLSINLQ